MEDAIENVDSSHTDALHARSRKAVGKNGSRVRKDPSTGGTSNDTRASNGRSSSKRKPIDDPRQGNLSSFVLRKKPTPDA